VNNYNHTEKYLTAIAVKAQFQRSTVYSSFFSEVRMARYRSLG